MKKETAEWVQKAEVDYAAAKVLAPQVPPLHDAVCFHCQQAAEKYLKALLEELGQASPKTHDLQHLLGLIVSRHPSLRSVRRGLLFLTDFAVDTRYPGAKSTKRQAVAALRWAGRVRQTCRSLLNIRPRRRGRKKS